MDVGPVEGWDIGPSAERIVYELSQQRDMDNDLFWDTVTNLIQSYPGGYHDLPDWCTEQAVDALLENDD